MPCGVRTFLPRIAPPTIVWKSFAVRGRTLPALAHFFNSLDEFSRFFDARLDALCDNDGFCGPRRLDAASPLPIQTTYKKAAPPDAGGRKAMNIKMKTLAAATAAAACAAGQAHAGFLEAVIDTTPAGYVSSSAERPGDFGSFWQDTVRGAKAIMKEGNSLWVVPTYTNHPTWDWDKRHEENGYPFGMGLGRQVIDNRGNERSFFLVTFVDSNYRPEPVAGYQWVARWPVAGTGLHVGAGYLAAVSARGDYMWVPFPMPLPVAKIGTDDISFYGTYIPVTNVFFFYSTITIDDAKRHDLPLPATSAWSADRNYLYGGWGWEYMDNGEEFSPSNVKNDSSWHVGMRHYSGRHWATDVSYRRSEHDIKTAGTDTSKSYRFQTWAVQLQYNIDALDSLRLYAGGGLGYSKMKGPAGKDDSFHPVTSLGATYAVTKNVFVNAEMFTSFARYKGTVEARGDDYVLKPMATDFTLSLGVAF